MKVFLGGTCNDSKWRDLMITYLNDAKVEYFNPVVEDWDEECQREEYRQRNTVCDILLYTITPKMTGVYAIAEVVDDSRTRPSGTIMVILDHDEGEMFNASQLKSLEPVAKMVNRNGGLVFNNLKDAAYYIACIKESRDAADKGISHFRK